MIISIKDSLVLNFLIVLDVHTDSCKKYLTESKSDLLDPEINWRFASIFGFKNLFKIDRSKSTSETSNDDTNESKDRMLLVFISSL
jgi:hypothetical protein